MQRFAQTVSMLSSFCQLLLFAGAFCGMVYVLSIGPVSHHAQLSSDNDTFPCWCEDIYQPLYELHRIPMLARVMTTYCDLWDVPFWLPRSLLVEGVSFRHALPDDDLQAENSEDDIERAEQEFLQELNANVAKFLSADTSRDAGEFRLKLFQSPLDGSVEILARHDSPQIAIQAAWQRYHRMIPRRSRSAGSPETIDPRDLERFLGFLEGRAHVLVPDWWEHALADPERHLLEEQNPSRRGWMPASELIQAKDADSVKLEIYGDEVRIPAASLKEIMSRDIEDVLGVEKNDRHLILLEYNHIAAMSHLVCIDLDERKEAWQNIVWGTGGEQVPLRTGPPLYHHVSIEITEKRVFVFGAMTNGYGMYVDGFSLADGAPIIRFATNNWMVEERKPKD